MGGVFPNLETEKVVFKLLVVYHEVTARENSPSKTTLLAIYL